MVLFLMVMGNMISIYHNGGTDASKKYRGVIFFLLGDLVAKLTGLWVEMKNRGLKSGGILALSTY
jgi:hypothetical protein